MIEMNITFNESALLRKKEETTSKINTIIQDNVSKKIEFEDMGTQNPRRYKKKLQYPIHMKQV